VTYINRAHQKIEAAGTRWVEGFMVLVFLFFTLCVVMVCACIYLTTNLKKGFIIKKNAPRIHPFAIVFL
jgi:hypothetical protein